MFHLLKNNMKDYNHYFLNVNIKLNFLEIKISYLMDMFLIHFLLILLILMYLLNLLLFNIFQVIIK